MEQITTKLVYFAVDLILPLFLGYACRFQNKLGGSFFDRMMITNILVIYPVLSVFSFWDMQLNLELVWLPVLGVLMSVVPALLLSGGLGENIKACWIKEAIFYPQCCQIY